MPIVNYKCKKCGEKFEEFRYSKEAEISKDTEVRCPKCGTAGPERLILPVPSASVCGAEESGRVHA
jgi:putative FmdB family regulatory protein